MKDRSRSAEPARPKKAAPPPPKTDEGTDLQALAKQIEALPPSKQLILAAGLLDHGKTRLAHTIVNRVATELGAALCLARTDRRVG